MKNKVKPEPDTIFAPATVPGRSGVAVTRISGPAAGAVLRALSQQQALPAPRHASLRTLFDARSEQIDTALVFWFQAAASFTGENTVEIHTHGSPAVQNALSAALFKLGLRQAEPGEFSRRALENGKMDLTEAEGLADLIDAETEGQRKQALRQMSGGLKCVYENWRQRILDGLAMIEGEIDFPDEGDVPDILARRAGPILQEVCGSFDIALSDSIRGECIRHGVDVAVFGTPNTGKSSIINRLSGRDLAIVSPEAGTTRDIVEVHLTLSGLPVRLSDTAGVREARGAVEAEGVRRARLRVAEANLRILVVDATGSPEMAQPFLRDLEAGDFVAINKTDLVNGSEMRRALNVSRETFLISAKTGAGFNALEKALSATIAERFGVIERAGLTRQRHRDCVAQARKCVASAMKNLSILPELAGDDLRRALQAIRELAGEADIEAVLDRVFSSFCIGK